ncbi:hypothetical protein [Mechercharimyces sp. CAU 1602]|uniref:hypothetical protein n=1 Tax=Mechercharimyces sp. CAU 1602 TaxID=2973933 RepID=UPI002162EFBD|nr:hypothetical protein [Mechercharimyces sp. CAU 1602]MCS1350308.1 hypothetical protein [Mechercharimyces sp. CAU 1602]
MSKLNEIEINAKVSVNTDEAVRELNELEQKIVDMGLRLKEIFAPISEKYGPGFFGEDDYDDEDESETIFQTGDFAEIDGEMYYVIVADEENAVLGRYKILPDDWAYACENASVYSNRMDMIDSVVGLEWIQRDGEQIH